MKIRKQKKDFPSLCVCVCLCAKREEIFSAQQVTINKDMVELFFTKNMYILNVLFLFYLSNKLTESDIHGHVIAILGESDEIHLFLHDF